MRDPSLQPTPLTLWFGVMAAIGSLAALQASLWPRWPQARPLPAEAITAALRQAGLDPAIQQVPAGSLARGQRNHELAVSPALAYRLPGGEELRLLRGVSRQRGSLQVASFAQAPSPLALRDRRLQAGPPAHAVGLLQGRPALQTCLVTGLGPRDGYGVTNEQLTPLADIPALGRQAELRRFLGLQANREYACVLVSLRSGDGRAVPESLWKRLLAALPPAFEPDSPSQRPRQEQP